MALDYKRAGCTAVAYSANGTTYTVINAKIVGIENLAPTAVETQTTNSKMLAGRNWSPTINLTDFQDFSTVIALSTARTPKFWAFQFDGYYFATTEAVPCLVNPVPEPDSRTGDTTWKIGFELVAATAISSPISGTIPV